jgi:dihydroorotase
LVTGSQSERAAAKGYVHVEVIGAITKNEAGKELAEMGDMAASGAL